MDLGLNDKVALIAGGSSGLGFSVAQALRADGAKISIGGRDPDRLAAAAERLGGDVLTHAVDVRDEAAVSDWVDAVVDAYGTLHIVVANSGGPPQGPATDFEVSDYREALENNTLSSIALVEYALPHLQAAGWGRILFIASSSARVPIATLALSNTARAAVSGYAKSLVTALGPGEITVNVLAPGTIRTPRIESLGSDFRKNAEARTPLGRIGEPEEFGAVAAFLASTRASFVTGAVVPIDGGMTQLLL